MSAAGRPLVELRDLAARGATGEFICATAAAEIHVYLQRGRVAWATASSHPFEFARYIKEHNKIDDATFRHLVEECRREKLPLGETMVAWDLVTWDDVNAALRHQVRLAMAAVSEMPAARTMFLERKHYTEYNAELTIDLASVLPQLPVRPSRSMRRVSTAPPTSPGYARQLLDSIEGAAWVELLEADDLLDGAPQAGGKPRVPPSLVENTLGDDADFVAVRSARGTIIGARLAVARRSVWCTLAADSTFGAAVSTLSSLSIVQLHESSEPRSSDTRLLELGDGASPAATEMRMVLGRAREVLAAIVLAENGEPVVGLARGGIEAAPCVELLRRRTRVFGVPMFDEDRAADDTEPRTGTRMHALGFTFRTLVTGERTSWCFGAELLGEGGQTLWVLTERGASQGLGWACLNALSRGLSEAGRATDQRAH